MNFLLRKRAGTALVIVSLAMVLVALAILQYHWSEELSEAAIHRMETALHSSLANFRQDLSRELASICSALQLNSDDVSRNGKAISQDLERWQRTAAHPTLIADVYLWQATPDG